MAGQRFADATPAGVCEAEGMFRSRVAWTYLLLVVGVWVGRDDLCVAEVGHDRLENSVIHRLCALHNSQ